MKKGFDLLFQCLTICCTKTGQPCWSAPSEEINRIKPFRASPNNTRLTFACSNMSDGKIEQFDVIRERKLTVSTNDLVTWELNTLFDLVRKSNQSTRRGTILIPGGFVAEVSLDRIVFLSLWFKVEIEVVGGHLNTSRGLVPGARGWIGWMERHSSLSRPQLRLVVASRCNELTRYTPLSAEILQHHLLLTPHLPDCTICLNRLPEQSWQAHNTPLKGKFNGVELGHHIPQSVTVSQSVLSICSQQIHNQEITSHREKCDLLKFALMHIVNLKKVVNLN